MNALPEMLKQGDKARLFPVLADTSREGRMASIFLAALPMVPSLAEEVLGTAGFRVGKRTRMETYTEVVLKNGPTTNDRPDGLIIAKNPKSSWSALVEAKVGKAELQPEQVERYLELAKANDIDAVVTISNQFVARADQSPVPVSKKLTKKLGLYHWSWTWLRTQCEILHYQQSVEDQEQKFIVSEFHRLLQHPGTGIERFTQMGQNWKEIVQSVTNKQHLKKSSPDVEDAVACWFSETRDLSLQLSRYIGKPVKERIERKFQSDGAARLKQGISNLVETNTLISGFVIPDAAADIQVCADLGFKTIEVSMKLKAPTDRKSPKARVNWLLKMLKKDDPRLIIEAHWPGRKPPTQKEVDALREDPSAIEDGASETAPHSLEIKLVEHLGMKRFAGRRTFIEDLERIVPEFYDLVGQYVKPWQAPPPKPRKKVPVQDEQQSDEETILEDEFASS